MAITLDVTEIKKILPHRFPMLLVDRILDLEPMKWAVGIKNISVNEMQFLGHFPDNPIMPGVLLIEAMAQVGGVAMYGRDPLRRQGRRGTGLRMRLLLCNPGQIKAAVREMTAAQK